VIRGREATIWCWPDSQICLECKHASRLNDRTRLNPDVACTINVRTREPSDCAYSIPAESEEDSPEHPGVGVAWLRGE